jgi:nucleoside-triphosphatase THEP1
VVIDEFGPLEVRGEGFADVLQRMLHLPPSHAPKLLVLLVRSTLVEQLAQSIRAADPHACIQFEPPME